MTRPTMSEINAYLDGVLDDERRREIDGLIRCDPEVAGMLDRYRQQVLELHRLYDSVLDEPVPERMLALLRGKRTS